MATGKRYYWIKLKEAFMNSDTVDYFMSQPNGANYVVLYQMLCLETLNTGGRLSRTIGEIVIPYDVEKIQRDCKWFSADTIRIALGLYKRFGLIYEEKDGTLVLTDHDNLVGSETDYAEKNRRLRARQARALPEAGHNVSADVSLNVPRDIRDKETRDKRLDTRDKEKENTVVGGNPFGDDNDNDDGRPDLNTIEVYASSNLQYLSPANMDELVSFRDTLPDDLIRFGIDQACANGVRKYAYVRAILNRYIDDGIRTVGDAKAAEAKRQQGGRGANGPDDYGPDDDDPYKDWRRGNG